MPKLTDTQQLFWRLIRAPEGVAAAVGALADRERLLPQGLDGWVRGDARLGALDRLGIYANMYFFRLLECLAEDFPALHAVVGHDRFHALAADYLAVHPSEHPSVRMLGHALGDFLETHPLSRERFYLPDLARFEWALLAAFSAEDRPAISEDRLKDVAPDDWPRLRLTLSPSLRLLEARGPVHELWSAATEGGELPDFASRPTALRVWREDLRVFHRAIDAAELAALRAVECGAPFGDVCEAAAAVVGEEAAAREVLDIVHRWLGDTLIVALDVAAPA